jgi:1-acyl-sn-glycerol-3-phosphate acyltransferase
VAKNIKSTSEGRPRSRTGATRDGGFPVGVARPLREERDGGGELADPNADVATARTAPVEVAPPREAGDVAPPRMSADVPPARATAGNVKAARRASTRKAAREKSPAATLPAAPPPGAPAPSRSRIVDPFDDERTPNVLNDSLDALHGLAGGILESLAPQVIRDLNREIGARIAKAPLELNSYGYDPWGLNVDVARRTLVVFALFYKYYFRVQTRGIENLPRGRMLVIANHAGQIAIDACMIGTATVLEADPPRPLRGMGEYWLPTLPFVNVFMARVGGVVGTPKNAVDILEHGEAVIAFPEGVRGMNKPFSKRYQLQEFGNGFMRLALETNTPIVPVAVVGSEEQAPSLGSIAPLARLLNMPAFPMLLTPFPLPVRYHIYFGEPMEFRGNHNDEDEVIVKKVNQVKDRINEMIQRGLRQRRGLFV